MASKRHKEIMKTVAQAKKLLEKLKYKAPRVGVHPTKVVPDKTKYTRKKKHRKKNEQS